MHASCATSLSDRLLRLVLIPGLALGAWVGAGVVGGLSAGRAAALEDESPEDAAFETHKAKFEAERDEEPFDRIPTIEGFGAIPSEKSAPFLLELLDTEPPNLGIRVAIVKALGMLGTEPAIRGLVEKGVPLLGTGPDFEILGEATLRQALANPMDAKAEAWLLKNGLRPAVRELPGLYKVMLGAIAGLKSEKKNSVITGELRAAKRPDAQAALLEVFRDRKLEGAAKAATKFLSSSDLTVRIAAMEVLLAVKDTSSTVKSRCQRLLSSPEWQMQILSIEMLRLHNDPKLLKRFLPLLESPNDAVKITVIAALVDLGIPDVIEPLFMALDVNKGRVQDDLADALARLTGKDFGPISTQWESWWAVNRDKADIRKRSLDEYVALKNVDKSDKATVLYHGLRVASDKVAFIIDCSESMKERYVLEPDPADDESKKPSGKTVVKGGKDDGKSGKPRAEDFVPKIDVAKAELAKVLKQLRDGVSVNVVRFNTFIYPWREALQKLNASVRRDALVFVNDTQPEGMTNIYEAIETAFHDESVDTIFLLSDGAPTHGAYVQPMDILENVGHMNRLRKVKINAIGFNLKPEEKQLLMLLADQNQGVFISR